MTPVTQAARRSRFARHRDTALFVLAYGAIAAAVLFASPAMQASPQASSHTASGVTVTAAATAP